MRINPTDTSIHDLTADEAASLRDVCERMLCGPVDLTHPMIAQWAASCGFDERQSLLAATEAFLPRALHALLLRAEST